MEDVHVVIEHRVGVSIFVKQPLRIGDTEVLEMEEAVRVILAHKLDKPVVISSVE